MSKLTRSIALILFISFWISYSFSFGQGNSYYELLMRERNEKDYEFVNSVDSPLTQYDKENFKGLNYFDADPNFVINAKIEKSLQSDTIKMKTTTERLPLYIIYGTATFSLSGKNHHLTIFQNVGLMKNEEYKDYLFIPFTDETSGEDSYGGGRYIDARITSEDTIMIDFNRAYNPYCVYNKKYSCPIPPSENHLDIKITAGEKSFLK